MRLHDRQKAGQLLAERLRQLSFADASSKAVVIALPRGGVPIAYEIARGLGIQMDVLVVRKVGAPQQPEYGIGAITENNHYWIDPQELISAAMFPSEVDNVLSRERLEVQRRIHQYRNDRPLTSVVGRTVIVVDDGLATGVTARVACAYLKKIGASRIILAVPVCAPGAGETLRREVDQFVCLLEPSSFFGVGQFYENFAQLSDDDVLSILKKASIEQKSPTEAGTHASGVPVTIAEGSVVLAGTLAMPLNAKGLVIFAHGSGSSRFSPRNQNIARALNLAGLGTLLFDLLSEEESIDRTKVFDIPLLASRLSLATDWVRSKTFLEDIPIGYFGASTGGGAALWAAADGKHHISAIVSRGGRPDLAGERLKKVSSPTLLIVGSDDHDVIELNKKALSELANVRLTLVPGATHLFEEPGALDVVSREAADWFLKYLKRGTHLEVA